MITMSALASVAILTKLQASLTSTSLEPSPIFPSFNCVLSSNSFCMKKRGILVEL